MKSGTAKEPAKKVKPGLAIEMMRESQRELLYRIMSKLFPDPDHEPNWESDLTPYQLIAEEGYALRPETTWPSPYGMRPDSTKNFYRDYVVPRIQGLISKTLLPLESMPDKMRQRAEASIAALMDIAPKLPRQDECASLAEQLKALGLTDLRGRAFTADSVRKFYLRFVLDRVAPKTWDQYSPQRQTKAPDEALSDTDVSREGESSPVPVGDDQRIREAVDFINEKANETVYRGFLEIGNYILERFFEGSIEQARSRNPRKSASFRALCGHPDLAVSPATLSIMLRVAAQEKLFEAKKLPLEKLSYSHKAELVRLEDDAAKIRLFKEAVKESLSVRALHERVRQERAQLPATDLTSRAGEKAVDFERLLHNPIFSDAEKLKVLSAGKREKLRTQVEESFARLTQLVEDYSRLRLLLADPKTENDD